jgi:hypothetical protein
MYISLSAYISILALMYMQHQLKILQDVEKQVGTHVSLSKQLGILVSTLNTIVKNHNIIEENADQCGPVAKKQKYEGYPRSNAQSDVVSKHFIFKLHLH